MAVLAVLAVLIGLIVLVVLVVVLMLNGFDVLAVFAVKDDAQLGSAKTVESDGNGVANVVLG